LVPSMRKWSIGVPIFIGMTILVLALYPICGQGRYVSIADVFTYEDGFLLTVSEMHLTQATTLVGVMRQSVETFLGGVIHPTEKRWTVRIVTSERSKLGFASLANEGNEFWIRNETIYTWQRTPDGEIVLSKWDRSGRSFVTVPREEAADVVAVCWRAGADCRGLANKGGRQGIVHTIVRRGFNGRIEVGEAAGLVFTDHPGGAYSIALATLQGANEVLRARDEFRWERCVAAPHL